MNKIKILLTTKKGNSKAAFKSIQSILKKQKIKGNKQFWRRLRRKIRRGTHFRNIWRLVYRWIPVTRWVQSGWVNTINYYYWLRMVGWWRGVNVTEVVLSFMRNNLGLWWVTDRCWWCRWVVSWYSNVYWWWSGPLISYISNWKPAWELQTVWQQQGSWQMDQIAENDGQSSNNRRSHRRHQSRRRRGHGRRRRHWW